jgi:putative DNA primase/helicase
MDSPQFAERITDAKHSPNGQWQGRCPAHDDQHASLTWSDGDEGLVLKCFAGCDTKDVLAKLGLTFSDIFHRTDSNSRHWPRTTVDDLAASKSLPREFLQSLGVEETSTGVRITYRLADGTPASRQRRRTAVAAKYGSSWSGPKGSVIEPYGSWRLGDARSAGFLLLVEGESDCWSAWFHGYPALGIPGADMAKVLTSDHLEGIKKVYVLREPDRGGVTFVKKIGVRLQSVGWPGTALVIAMPDNLKDLNDLHRDGPERFRERLQQAMKTGMPISSSTLEDVETGEPNLIEGFHRTDLGNSERLVAQFGGDIRWVPQWGWMVWDGHRWAQDHGACEVIRLAAKTVRTLYADAAKIEDTEERKLLVAHAKSSEARPRLEAMVKLAEHQVKAQPSEFDRNPWLLNVQNGTIDLRTGTLRSHRREDFITKIAPVSYDCDASAPQWDQFLNDVTASNPSLVRFLQKAVGYSLTGCTDEQVLFMLYGVGANGKTTFLKLIGEVLDDYAMQTPSETLLAKREGSIPNDLARLKGARLVTAIETEDGRRLAEALVKQMTGGDKVAARFLHKEFFEFMSEFKLFLSVNHKPHIRGTDHAIWRRIRLVPFTVTFRQPDKTMAEKLRAELPGILAWAVQGCLRWQAEGLGLPDEVRAATEGYQQEEDVLAQFIEECCLVIPTARVQARDLYTEYARWSAQAGEYQLPQKVFVSRLMEKRFERRKTSGVMVWTGLGLLVSHREAGRERERLSEIFEDGASQGEKPAVTLPDPPSLPGALVPALEVEAEF